MKHLDTAALERLYELASDTAGGPLLDGDTATRTVIAMDPERVIALVDEIEQLRHEVKYLERHIDLLMSDDAA